MRQRFLWMLVFGMCVTLLACAPTPTETTTVTPALTFTATAPLIPTATPKPTLTPVPTRTPTPTIEQNLVIGTSMLTARHFNPIWLSSAPQFLAFPLILPALTWFDHQAQPILALATRVEIAPSANAYTFTLPSNAMWSDGTRITARDVAFTYKLALDPAIKSSLWGTNLASIKGAIEYQRGATRDIEGIKVVDDQTIRFDLREPNATFVFNTYLGILPAHILGKVNPRDLETHPYLDAPTVTSGPYEFVQYELGKFIRLKKKSNYWGKSDEKSFPADTITLWMFDSSAALLDALEAGTVHLAALPADVRARARASAQLDVLTAPGTDAYVLHVDARTREQIAALNRPRDQGGRGYAIPRLPKPYLADKRFRQALSYALNRQALVQNVLNGEGTPIVSPIYAPRWFVNPQLNPYEWNLERARDLMRQAGITFDAQGVALFEQRPITLVYLASQSDDARKLGEEVQKQLSEVGIRVEIKQVPQENFWRAAINGEGDLMQGVAARLGVDPSVSALYYTCKAGWAELVLGYCNPKLDEWMNLGNANAFNEARQQPYWNASAILNEELPSLFLFVPHVTVAVNKKLTGVQPVTDVNFLTWNLLQWTVQK